METTMQHSRPTLSNYSTQLAVGSFFIGTLLFASYQVLPNYYNLLIIGIYFLLFATLVNGVVLLNLGYQFIMLPKYREELAIKMLIVLANIPIVFFYLFLIRI